MEIAVACFTKRPAMYPNILSNILSQTRRPDVVSIVAHREVGDLDTVVTRLKSHGIPKVVTEVVGGEFTLFDVQRLAYSSADSVMGEDGSISSFEDDDWYGPGYLAEVERTFLDHPDAVATGKNEFVMRCISDGKVSERLCFSGGMLPGGACSNVAGPSISIRVAAWREFEQLRFNPQGPGKRDFPDMAFREGLLEICRVGTDHSIELPLYATGKENFAVQRYKATAHDHTWKYLPPEFR